jgi:hypothetical protein
MHHQSKQLRHALPKSLLGLGLLLAAGTLGAQVRVTVGHFAPFANSVDGTSVSIRVNGQPALSNVKFGEFTNYINLGPDGNYLIEVIPTGATTPAIRQSIAATAGDYSVLAVGDGTNQTLSLLTLPDNNTAPGAGNIKLRVVHAAPFAASLDATAVSIRDQANAVVGGLGNVPFKVASGYLEVPAGRYDLKVANPGGTQTFIDLKPLNLAAGSIVTVVATGGANTLPLGVTGIAAGASPRNALPLFTIGPVKVRAVHAAPFARNIDNTSVSIRVNGNVVAQNVKYKEFSGELDLPEQGSYRFEVVPTGTTTAAINEFVDLDGNTSYNVAAVGDGKNQVLSFFTSIQDRDAPAAGQYKIRIAHAAPFAPTLEGTRVSIRTDGGDVVAGLASVPYKAASGVLALPVGALDIKVATPNGATNLIDVAPLNLPTGANVTAYAIGDGVNQPVGILAVPVGEVPTEKAIDFATGGHWIDPAKTGQGIDFLPIPRENRMVGTWYTFAADGSGVRWYIMDTCRSAIGSTSCARPGAFANNRAELSIYEASGGRLNQAGNVTTREVGVMTVDFTDCKNATANFTFTGGATGTMSLKSLIQSAGCE